VGGRAEEVTLRFRAGGGRPPSSHEVLLVEDGGEAWYLTGLPWPRQPPFDEIGAYRRDVGAEAAGRLGDLARAVLAAPPAPDGPADAGLESVRLEGAEADWSPRRRPDAAEPFVEEARAVIAAVRERPWAAVQGVLGGGRLELRNRGLEPLAVEGIELRAGWGRSERAPSPLRLAERPSVELDLPPRLEPGATADFELPSPGEPEDDEYDRVYALAHLRWRPPVAGEGDRLDGWIVAGPA
jgi:hypothetical protein